MTDEFYMKRALKLALRGEGSTSPNPMVGAVIVKNKKIIGEGYHRRFGENHAEINAIESVSEPIEGATFYVTLEPCSHQGKTPPCVYRIIDAKPLRVVVGTIDPNPVVSGRGIRILEDNGIKTTVGVLGDECARANEKFFKFMKTGMPFVTLKYAQSLDGRIASHTGHSRWISSEESLKFAHKLRSRHDAIMVGVGTVLNDDPDLTVRMVKGRNPIRIIIDSTLKIGEDARVLKSQGSAKTIIATTKSCDNYKLSMLKKAGIKTLVVDEGSENRVDLKKLFAKLGKMGISSILVEGGAGISTSIIGEGLFDRLIVVTAPRIIGKGIEAVGDLGISNIGDSIGLIFERVYRKGGDVVIECVRNKR
jgi:diaminohydroxyphosphoribosylaminopyrimidine deaminase/5-amino-6-(5-phosphoribosylamino)uracil reductase